MITSDELSISDKDKVPRAAGNETTLRNHFLQDQARRLGFAVDSLDCFIRIARCDVWQNSTT
jgi:hypothetical protein